MLQKWIGVLHDAAGGCRCAGCGVGTGVRVPAMDAGVCAEAVGRGA